MRKLLLIIVFIPIFGGLAWWYFSESALPDYGPAYREYAYVTNGKSNTVSVIDLRTFQLAKTIAVGVGPTGIAANSKKNEIYLVNTGLGNVRVGLSPGLARVSPDGATVVVSNRGDNTVSLIDARLLRVRATLPVCRQPEDIAILADSSKAFVACSGSGQVASINLKKESVLALLDVGRTPVSLALKPDGGELIVCNFDSDSISIIETGNDEVGSSEVIGQHPSHGIVTLDNSRLYVTNFGSDSVAVYDIDLGRRLAVMPVGRHPDGMALSQDQNYLLVLDTQSGDVTVIQKRKARKLEPTEYSLLTMIPVGVQPNGIVVKSFIVSAPVKK